MPLEEVTKKFHSFPMHPLNEVNAKETPIFIINYNQLFTLKGMIDWLTNAKYKNIFIIDNASCMPELLEYYDNTPAKVVRMEKNYGHKVMLKSGLQEKLKPFYYVITDPDLIFPNEFPNNFVWNFYKIYNEASFPDCQKIGPALKIDDLPDSYPLKNKVIEWESQFWEHRVRTHLGDGYIMLQNGMGIDTTLALYPPNFDTRCRTSHSALRMAGRHVPKHAPWYLDPANLPSDIVYYNDKKQNPDQAATNWSVI